MKLKSLLAVVAGAVFAVCAYADTWYADASKEAGTGDGKSPATAFHTIQEAVDEASAGDTVVVLPGVYDQGSKAGLAPSGQTAGQVRVVVDKVLTIRSRDGRDVTHVVGDYGDTTYPNNTKTCVGGFHVKEAASGTIIEGFTIRDCAQWSMNGVDDAGGGAVSFGVPGLTNAFYVAYCAISNCCAYNGGAMRSGVAIGTLFSGNWCYSGSGSGERGSAGREISAYNCIFANNGVYHSVPTQNKQSENAIRNPGLIVNCTFVNTYGRHGLFCGSPATVTSGRYFNVVCYDNKKHNTKGDGDAYAEVHNSVFDMVSDNFASVDRLTSITPADATQKTNLCVCPILRDYRPVKGGRLDGTGDSQYLTLDFIPAQYRYRDFDGKAFAPSAAIPIGAILPAAEVASGALLTGYQDYLNVDGLDSEADYICIQSATWPRSVRFADRASAPLTGLLGLSYNGHRHYFGKYDCFHLPLPAKVDEKGVPYALSITDYSCSLTLYVGGEGASDETGDGSADKPYATIQAAVDDRRVSGKDVHTLISVRPGTYGGEGREDPNYSNFKSAVVVPAKTHVFIRAESDNRGATVLWGAPDPDTKDIGDGAVRCISAQSSATFGICGFTLSGGYAGVTKETYAGAIRGGGQNQQAVDCVFTDNHGNAAVGNQIWFRRCLFTNNTIVATGSGSANGVIINSNASGCIFAENHFSANGGYLPIANSSHTYNCTIYEPEGGTSDNVYNGNSRIVNTVIAAGGFTPVRNNGRVAGCVIDAVKDTNADPDTVHGDAGLSDPAHGDFRPFTVSPALGAGVGSDSLNVVTTLQFVEMDTCGYFNDPIVAADGTITSGAVMETCEPRSVFVSPSGNDDNDGSTEALAKQTINAGIAASRLGIELTVLPGVYKVGKLPHEGAVVVGTATPALNNRVVVPAGYTLKSRDGAEATIIEGEPDPDTEGCGPHATRCVFLETGAKIVGFTLRGGYTCDNSIGNEEDTYGAAVLGRGYTSGTRVVDCIIAGNTGCRGGGGGYVIFDRCIVTNNVATTFGSAGIFCSAFNSYFAESYGPRVLNYPTELVNCTFGEGCLNAKGGTATYQFFAMADVATADSKIVNVLIAGATTAAAVDLSKIPVRNFVVPSGMGYIYGEDASGLVTNLTLAAIAAGYDADRHPISAEAVGVDIGFGTDLAGGVDLAGSMRVANGTIDVGCYEYDWKGDYAKALGRRVTVTEASGTLVMTDGHPQMRDGDALAATVAARSSASEGDYVVKAVLTGTGKMLVYLNGVLLGELTASGELRFTNGLASNDLRFEYEGEGSAYVAKVAQELGGLLIIR